MLHDPTPPVLQTSPALEGVEEVARASFSAELQTGDPEEESSGATVAALGNHTGNPLWKRLLRVVWREEDSSCTVRCRVWKTSIVCTLNHSPHPTPIEH